MPSTIELVVNLEDPGGDIQILRNELRQGVDELLFIIDINAADRRWHIGQLKDLLRTGFGGVQVLFGRFSAQDWDCQSDGELDVIDRRCARDNEGLLTLNQVLHLFQGLGTVDQNLGERKVMWESVHVVWDQDVKTALGGIDFTNLKNFHVVAQHIAGHLEWGHVNDLNIWVFQSKYSTKLSILALQKLCHGDTLELFDGNRADVNLYPTTAFD